MYRFLVNKVIDIRGDRWINSEFFSTLSEAQMFYNKEVLSIRDCPHKHPFAIRLCKVHESDATLSMSIDEVIEEEQCGDIKYLRWF